MRAKSVIIAIFFVFGLLFFVGASYTIYKQNQQLRSWNNGLDTAKEHKTGNTMNKVVFIGNSITEEWVHLHFDFFENNNYTNRGIGGQTTPQFLLRFRRDVIDLNPKVVVINGGINDIAENTGGYNPEFTLGNIKSMAEIAHANGIKVILTSVLPAKNIPWNPLVLYVPEKIVALNNDIKTYAEANNFIYVDYYPSMVAPDKSIIAEYTRDGLHVNSKGYFVMEPMIKEAINKALEE